ncbi:MAG: hypothetical protein WDN29_07895 [Methylovirgula sp.]
MTLFKFGWAASIVIVLYDPTVGTKPIQKLSNAHSVEITLSDHPIVVALPPTTK